MGKKKGGDKKGDKKEENKPKKVAVVSPTPPPANPFVSPIPAGHPPHCRTARMVWCPRPRLPPTARSEDSRLSPRGAPSARQPHLQEAHPTLTQPWPGLRTIQAARSISPPKARGASKWAARNGGVLRAGSHCPGSKRIKTNQPAPRRTRLGISLPTPSTPLPPPNMLALLQLVVVRSYCPSEDFESGVQYLLPAPCEESSPRPPSGPVHTLLPVGVSCQIHLTLNHATMISIAQHELT